MNAIESLEHDMKGRHFLHALQAWIRQNHDIVPRRQDDPIPPYDLHLMLAAHDQAGPSPADFFREHLPFLLTLLPKGVAIMDRAALESYMGMLLMDPNGKADPIAGRHLLSVIETKANAHVMAQSYEAEAKRRGRL